MTFDFSNASTEQFGGGELIPAGTLAKGVINIKRQNGNAVTMSSNTGSQYLDLDIVITEGQYIRRHVFTKVGIAHPESEAWVNQGRAQIRAILEYGRGASAANPNGYKLNDFAELDGLPCAIKIGVEKDKNGQYADKNSVMNFLSPNPESSTHKDFQKLTAGQTSPSVGAPNPGQQLPAQQSALAGTGSQGGAPVGGKPSWL